MKKVCDFIKNKYFDLKNDINTGGIIEPWNMLVNTVSIKHARRCQSTHIKILEGIFLKLNLDWDKYNFIDFGAGKGRVLIYTSRYRFRQLIGIEFADNVFQELKANIDAYIISSQYSLNNFNLIHCDVLDYDIADGPNIYYFYNPFDANILKPVLKKIKERNNKNDIIIYVNPIRSFLLELLEFTEIIKIENNDHNRQVLIYKTS